MKRRSSLSGDPAGGRRWRLHPRHRLSKARVHRSRPRHLPWRWGETVASPAILSDPFRAGSGDGASSGYPPKSGNVESRDPAGGRLVRRLLWVLLLVLWAPLVVLAQESFDYGEIRVERLLDLPSGKTHGYHEHRFSISNASGQRAHTVTLRLPADSFGNRFGLSSFESSIRVEPQSTVQLSMLQPDLPVSGQLVSVFVDGTLQTQSFPWQNEHPVGRIAVTGMYPAQQTPLRLLVGLRTKTEFLQPSPDEDDKAKIPGVPTEILQTQLSMAQWSTRWLAYSGYDGIVLAWPEMQSAPPQVAAALWKYVEAGGNLLLLEVPAPVRRGEVPLRLGDRRLPAIASDVWDGSWRDAEGHGLPPDELTWTYLGFGEVLFGGDGSERVSASVRQRLGQAWNVTRAPWAVDRDGVQTHRLMPVVEGFELPLRGLFVLVLCFSLLVGPLNLWWLSRRKRRLWLLWTVPALSLLACLLVVVIAMAGEGFQYRGRSLGLTVLDQQQRWAATLAWSGYYASTGTDGLRYSLDTEVAIFGGMDGRREMVVGGEQLLTRGWMAPRLPAYFLERRHQRRRERLQVTWGEESLWVVNGLGADLDWLVVADAEGRIYRSPGPLAAGAKVMLPRQGQEMATAPPSVLRMAFSDNTAKEFRRLEAAPEKALRPSTYLAKSRRSPFLEVALAEVEAPQHHGLIYGLLGDAQ